MGERIFARPGKISVYDKDVTELWYTVETLRTSPDDYSWMLENRPAKVPFTVTNENVKDFKKLALGE